MASAPANAVTSFAEASDLVTLTDIVISDELMVRRMRKRSARAEIVALHELAELLPQGSPVMLKRLATLAVELCGAGSGGISMLEHGEDGNELFRWRALAGVLGPHEGGTTPRDWSPCGECLRAGKPMLYSYPARFFTYFQGVDIVLVEGLVIPMYDEGKPIGTIWIISHDPQQRFDAEDVRIMTSLGNFVVSALRVFASGRHYSTAGIEHEAVWTELVSRIVNGDHSALEILIEETRPFVFSRALRILSSPADAEETMADVYAQAWRTAARYNPDRFGVLPWLMNMARSRAIDRVRSRAFHDQQSEVNFHVDYSGVIDGEACASKYEIRTLIGHALEALPFEQQKAIKLAYFNGYTLSEIANELHWPLGTVKTRVRNGLLNLRRLIATTYSHVPRKSLLPRPSK